VEALKGQKTANEIASEYEISPFKVACHCLSSLAVDTWGWSE